MSEIVQEIIKGRNKIVIFDNGRRKVIRNFEGESRTQQSHRQMTNINTIVSKALKGQTVPITSENALYGDFTQFTDFQDAQNKIIEAREAFMNLPSQVRKACNNDPAVAVDYINNPDNKDFLIQNGVLEPPLDWVPPDKRNKGDETPNPEPSPE